MENHLQKKSILLVDDDPIVLRIYRAGLTRHGFEVRTAADGLEALQTLRSSKPDLVVLDLMMPRFSGVEVLKFIRGEKEFATLPVIVLSNAYMDQLARDAAALGAQKGLLKIKCNPASLAAAINGLLVGQPDTQGSDHLLAASKVAAKPVIAQPKTLPGTSPLLQTKSVSQPAVGNQDPKQDPKEQAQQELMVNAQAICGSLGQLLEAFKTARSGKDRELRLHDLTRKIHFITAMAGIAEYHAMAQMASAFEALLFSMMDKLPKLEASLGRTSSMAVDFLQSLVSSPADLRPVLAPHPWVLVVDDDRLSNRLVISALRNAQLHARGAESPEVALHWLKEKQFDLLLLDIEMPGMDGIELCKRARRLPGYEKTPIIYVTLHSDFETLGKSALSGADDLISKPILATELAVKAVMHLLKGRGTQGKRP
jgi:CheY-like chemotaxis protein